MMRMSPDLYWVACTLAGEWRRGYLPEPVNLLSAGPSFPHVNKAVYVACDRSGNVVYVGKVSRRGRAAVAARVSEHVRSPDKAGIWAHLYVVPLRTDTPPEIVLELEGTIGRRLTPSGSRRLPRAANRGCRRVDGRSGSVHRHLYTSIPFRESEDL
jgi:hypothetical protein